MSGTSIEKTSTPTQVQSCRGYRVTSIAFGSYHTVSLTAAVEHASSNDAPQELRCPISGEIMRDPVRLSDDSATYYDRASLECWFQSQTSSPLLGTPMAENINTVKMLPTDETLLAQIREFESVWFGRQQQMPGGRRGSLTSPHGTGANPLQQVPSSQDFGAADSGSMMSPRSVPKDWSSKQELFSALSIQ